MAERQFCKLDVVGSIPTGGSILSVIGNAYDGIQNFGLACPVLSLVEAVAVSNEPQFECVV